MTTIVCAIKPEVKPFMDALQHKEKVAHKSLVVYKGILCGEEVMVARCGVGLIKSAAAVQALITDLGASKIIMSGTAGGIYNRLKIGDTVISDEIIYHEFGIDFIDSKADASLLEKADHVVYTTQFTQTVVIGRISSGSKFVTGKDRGLISSKYGPLCSDMETAAVSQVAIENNVPFIAVRSISDTKDKSGLINFFKYVSLASYNSFVVAQLLI